LRRYLRGRVVIVTLGGVKTGDDGIGTEIWMELRGKLAAPVIHAGLYLHNMLGVIARENPDTVILIDAADLGERPGCIRVLNADDILDFWGTSHGIPLSLLMKQLAKTTGAHVILVGIQFFSVRADTGLSRSARDAIKTVVAGIEEALIS
jgi:hydrogenase 3 maturation protease